MTTDDTTEPICDVDCKHRMHRRCPGCNVEMYGPAVYAFSHGEVRCSCGHKVEVALFRPHPSAPLTPSDTSGVSPTELSTLARFEAAGDPWDDSDETGADRG